MNFSKLLFTAAAVAAFAGSADAKSVAIVSSDSSPPVNELLATGKFTSVVSISESAGLTYSDLAGFDAVLAYSNFTPGDATNFGNVLKNFVDGGGQLVLATYGYSSPWSIDGGITGAGYAPLLNSGINTSVSGSVVQLATDSVFSGINLSDVSFFHNSNYASPLLAPGASLLADDGAGVAMIAVNASHNVYGFNIFPGVIGGTNSATYALFANALDATGVTAAVPEPATWAMMLAGFGIIGFAARRRQGVKATVTYA